MVASALLFKNKEIYLSSDTFFSFPLSLARDPFVVFNFIIQQPLNRGLLRLQTDQICILTLLLLIRNISEMPYQSAMLTKEKEE